MKTFIVLGMHRSATSLAAKGLHMAGVNMGDRLLGAHKSNPYGHWEDVEFIAMNELILKIAGGSWDDPPSEKAIEEAGNMLALNIKELVAKKNQQRKHWGWKDPRTTLTIGCYMPYIEKPHFVTCFRSYIDVAESLMKREGPLWTIGRGVGLAAEYNRRLLNFLDTWAQTELQY